MTTLSEAIRQRAESSGMSPAAALSYRLGAMEARLLIQTAAENALRNLLPSSKGIPNNG